MTKIIQRKKRVKFKKIFILVTLSIIFNGVCWTLGIYERQRQKNNYESMSWIGKMFKDEPDYNPLTKFYSIYNWKEFNFTYYDFTEFFVFLLIYIIATILYLLPQDERNSKIQTLTFFMGGAFIYILTYEIITLVKFLIILL